MIAAGIRVVVLCLYGTQNDAGSVGIRNGDDVTWYDGIVLTLPKWNKAKYPYAFLLVQSNGVPQLVVSSCRVAKNTDNTMLLYAIEDGAYVMYTQQDVNTWSNTVEFARAAGDLMFSVTGGEEPIPIWSNFDMNGTGNVLYLAATEPIPVNLADVVYREDAPPVLESMYLYGTPSESGNIAVRSGDSVTYYQGAVLPPLPEWDETAYPYAAIAQNNAVGTYLFLANAEPFEGGVNHTLTVLFPDVSYRLEDGAWQTYSSGSLNNNAVWSNYDVYYMENDNLGELAGTLYHAKSDPIPVSGIVDYVGDIPVYE